MGIIMQVLRIRMSEIIWRGRNDEIDTFGRDFTHYLCCITTDDPVDIVPDLPGFHRYQGYVWLLLIPA